MPRAPASRTPQPEPPSTLVECGVGVALSSRGWEPKPDVASRELCRPNKRSTLRREAPTACLAARCRTKMAKGPQFVEGSFDAGQVVINSPKREVRRLPSSCCTVQPWSRARPRLVGSAGEVTVPRTSQTDQPARRSLLSGGASAPARRCRRLRLTPRRPATRPAPSRECSRVAPGRGAGPVRTAARGWCCRSSRAVPRYVREGDSSFVDASSAEPKASVDPSRPLLPLGRRASGG